MSISLISKCVVSAPMWKKTLISQLSFVTQKQLCFYSALRKYFPCSCGFVRNFSTSRLALASSETNQDREKRTNNILMVVFTFLFVSAILACNLVPKHQDYVYIDSEKK